MKFWTNSYYNFIELFIEHYKRMNQERSNSPMNGFHIIAVNAADTGT